MYQYCNVEPCLPASALELEVAASAVMENIEAVIAKPSKLEQMGACSQSTTSALADLPAAPARAPAEGRPFGRELPVNTDAVAIARASHALTRMIAEGVVPTEQAEFAGSGL